MGMLGTVGVALTGLSHRHTPAGLAAHIVSGKWFMVYASMAILSVAGATYIFGVYSEEMKVSLGYDQRTLNTISFAKDLGGNLGVISGLIQEVLPPSAVLAIGAAMNLSGYLMIWLAITGRIAAPKVWEMCVYIFLGANSQAFANTGALVTCVKNFPESRGVVLGLLKGLVGLSGAVLTQLYRAFYGDDPRSLILFIGWLPAVVSVVFVYTVRIIRGRRRPGEIRTFYHFLYVILLLVAYLMVIIIVQNQISFPKPLFGASAAVVLLLVLFFPLVIVVKNEFVQWKDKIAANATPAPSLADQIVLSHVQVHNDNDDNEVDNGKGDGETRKRNTSCRWWSLKAPARGEDYTILQALVSVDMITLFVTSICGVGGTLTAIDNLGQIGKALGYPKVSISTCVSLISIWNCLGRLSSGFVSEIVLAKFQFPRPLLLTLVLLLACAGHLLIAFAPPNGIYVASVIVGFTFGAQWPVVFAIISEVFGLKYYSTLYNFGGMASPVGSYILNVLVAGRLYDREAMKQRAAAGVAAETRELTCFGVECYKGSFLIIAGATLFGAMVSLVLVARTYNFYQGDIYAKFREAEQEVAMKVAGGGNSAAEEPVVDRTNNK